jgi:CRP/FNR family transcriptional regulator, cyclic AMP receptor protein
MSASSTGAETAAVAASPGAIHDESDSTISLVQFEPEFAKRLGEEQRELAAKVRLPVVTLQRGKAIDGALDRPAVFGGFVLDGILLETVNVDTRPTLRLIGPGEPVPINHHPMPSPVADCALAVLARSHLVLLDEKFLLAARRWPWLMARLHARTLQQTQRVTAQLAISQLPRVEDRLMSLMWLLAETWGRVTPAGIRLDLPLSHEALGGLIGARRPTVTLAVKQLRDGGLLARRDGGWLIHQRPPAASVARRAGRAAHEAKRKAEPHEHPTYPRL